MEVLTLGVSLRKLLNEWYNFLLRSNSSPDSFLWIRTSGFESSDVLGWLSLSLNLLSFSASIGYK